MYYAADGRDPSGHPHIYEAMDWAHWGRTLGIAFASNIVRQM